MVSQLPFFPTPYPDELFYSLIARYHVRRANSSIKKTMDQLFGCPHNATKIELPNRLETLVSRLPTQTVLTTVKLIQETTLLPYFRPFNSWERTEAVVKQMCNEDYHVNAHSVLGQMTSRFPLVQTLRYCPECLDADKMKVGEPYWHRSHQIYSIQRCHLHQTWLRDSMVRVGLHGGRYSLVPLERNILPLNPSSVGTGKFAQHDWLATAVHWLLNGNLITEPPQSHILVSRYRDSLKTMGLAHKTRNIDILKFQERFLDFYGIDFLDSLLCHLDKEEKYNWLIDLLRNSRKISQPLYHLLLIRFLGTDIKDILRGEVVLPNPFGTTPWPCLNRAAHHYLKPVVTQCALARNQVNTSVTGNFTCECGFIYQRFGPDPSPQSRTSISRIVATGKLWDDELLRLVSTGCSIRETSRSLGVSTTVVTRNLARLVHQPSGIPTLDDLLRKQLLYRSRWQALCVKYPGESLADVSKRDTSLHRWLYNHDTEWLRNNSPPSYPKIGKRGVDWEKRDAELAKMIEPAAEIMREGTRMITTHAIATTLGVIPLLRANRDKLPRTRAALERVVESVEKSSLRRFIKAVADFNRSGEALIRSSLLKAAGISNTIAFRIADDIERIMEDAISSKI
jgi:hypothetical protein